MYGYTQDLEQPKQSEEEKQMEESGSLSSEYTAKLQKQKYKSAEQDRKPRNNPTQLWSINQRQRR